MTVKRNALTVALQAVLAYAVHIAPVADAGLTERGTLTIRAVGSDTVELLVYGLIGESWWGEESVTAKQVVQQLAESRAKNVLVRINSYGGSVADGVAIYNAIRRHKAKYKSHVITLVDGVACSIASLIAMAGDSVEMCSNTLMMIHAPWGGCMGNAKDMRETAAVLDTFAAAMATSYARKSGKTTSDVLALLSGDDHWYTAAQAKAEGFCDVVIEEQGAVDDDASTGDAEARLPQTLAARYIERAPAEIAASLRQRFHVEAQAVLKPAAAANPNPPPVAMAAGTPPAGVPAMPDQIPTPAADPAAEANQRTAILAADRERRTSIRNVLAAHIHNAVVASQVDAWLDDPGETPQTVGLKALALLGGQGAPAAGGTPAVTGGIEDREKFREAMITALGARASSRSDKVDQANSYRAMSLSDMARECAERAGVNVRGMDREAVVRAAISHTSSDFPTILDTTVRRAILRGYNEVPEVFDKISRPITVTDFKPTTLASLGNFIGIAEVKEGGEFKYGTLSEITGQPIKVGKRGALFSITREALVNDDIGLLDRIPSKMGQAAKRSLADDFWKLLTTNPVLSDGVALFHATHNNLMAASALSTVTVDGMRVLMARQTDQAGNTIIVRLKYLVVPFGLGGLAKTVLESQFEVGGAKNLTTPNIVRNTFEVIEDPRLDANSATAWYGVADPDQVEGLVIAYLNGKQEPTIESKEGWNVDGQEYKVRLEAGVGIADYRALAKNPGA